MANTPQSKKRARQIERRTDVNKARRSRIRTFLRKVEEAIITLMLENLWSKRRIFEVYLNVVEWGNGVFGAEAAAVTPILKRAPRVVGLESLAGAVA